MGRVYGPPPGLGGLDELEDHGQSSSRLPAPLVILVRKGTVAKVDSIGLVVRRWIQCSAGS